MSTGTRKENAAFNTFATPEGAEPMSPSVQEGLLRELVYSTQLSRSRLASAMTDDKRDIYAECGYPPTLSIDQYKRMYDREPIARRVVEILPSESWVVPPTVFENDDPEVEDTPFEVAWKELPKSLSQQSPSSWLSAEQGNPIWNLLQRADSVSGIGEYGIILLGIDDGKPLKEEAVHKEGQKLIFLRTFDMSLVRVASYESDSSSPRHGKPTAYHITFGSATQSTPESELTPQPQGETEGALVMEMVHWTRVIHLADNLTSNELFGTSRLQVPYNRLYDLIKLYSGSAEMYWLGALPGLVFKTHESMGLDGFLDEKAIAAMKDQVEQYQEGLKRYLSTQGMDVDSLAPQVVDPTAQIDAYIKAICILLGIPKRIFEGSERGELSSSQDAKAWNSRLKHRQRFYITPKIIAPFIDRLIWLGILPEPSEAYKVIWSDMEDLTELEQAEIAVKRMEAASAYVQGRVETMMTQMDHWTKVQGMTIEEATAVVEAATKAIEKDELTTIPEEPATIAPTPAMPRGRDE
jgi:hypothetical protein